MSKLELCQRLIEEAMKCLENNDKRCVTRLIEELVKADCHNGNAVGKEVADKVKDVVHELWLVSDYEFRCGLLKALRDLGISKSWVKGALRMRAKMWNKWLRRCDIEWEGRAARSDVVKVIESILRERFGWNEIRMCEELWRFVGVDVNEFRKYGIEPCIWLNGLETLNDLRNPYWLGLRASDLAVRRCSRATELRINTTNSIDAVFFAKTLKMVETPSLKPMWESAMPGMKYISNSIGLSFYIVLGVNEWPWPIELSANELKRILDSFSDEELAEFVAGEIDGDGKVAYHTVEHHTSVYVEITACKNCPKRFILDALKEVIAERFGIIGYVHPKGATDALEFGGEDAVKLLRRVVRYIHHPLRRLRAELILAYYDGKISDDAFMKLYEQTKYEQGKDDIKRNRGLEALARAAPQTHTHGEQQPGFIVVLWFVDCECVVQSPKQGWVPGLRYHL